MSCHIIIPETAVTLFYDSSSYTQIHKYKVLKIKPLKYLPPFYLPSIPPSPPQKRPEGCAGIFADFYTTTNKVMWQWQWWQGIELNKSGFWFGLHKYLTFSTASPLMQPQKNILSCNLNLYFQNKKMFSRRSYTQKRHIYPHTNNQSVIQKIKMTSFIISYDYQKILSSFFLRY